MITIVNMRVKNFKDGEYRVSQPRVGHQGTYSSGRKRVVSKYERAIAQIQHDYPKARILFVGDLPDGWRFILDEPNTGPIRYFNLELDSNEFGIVLDALAMTGHGALRETLMNRASAERMDKDEEDRVRRDFTDSPEGDGQGGGDQAAI